MKSIFRKIACLSLAALVALGALTGCGKNGYVSKLNEVTEACNPIVDEFNTALQNFESEEGAGQIGDILDRLQTEYKKILEIKAPKGYEDCPEKFQEAADKLDAGIALYKEALATPISDEMTAEERKAYTEKISQGDDLFKEYQTAYQEGINLVNSK